MQAVEKLGYTPNFGARALAAKRTYTIGAIIPTMENAIFARGLQAFQERLHDKGYTLLVSSTSYRPDREAEQIKTLVARGADGLLLIGYERDAQLYEYLNARQLPYLLAWAFDVAKPHPAIGFDNRAAMTTLTSAMLEMGHRDIAIISGVVKGNDRAAERVEGIRIGLRQAGLNPDAVPIIETPYSTENGARAFGSLMSDQKKPTLVMCGNDVLAVGAMQGARNMGLDVPGDVSITGFDDIEVARLVTPQLTTVHLPHRDMGHRAAEELVRLVEGDSPGASSRLDSSVQIRGSVRRII